MSEVSENSEVLDNIPTFVSAMVPRDLPPSGITDETIQRLSALSEVCRKWDTNPKSIPNDIRFELQAMLAATFKDFREFAVLGMRFLGFPISPMQLDIAWYMQHGDKKRMVQAQRGEAKSTLAALYAVWSLIHNPKYRVLVVSAASDQASDVAIMIVRLLERWFLLCWLRADSSKGDRISYEAYDCHYTLKGIDKSPSISCIGITANLPGRRADLLIPDDIETPKNSMTQTMREQLLMLSKEFTAICTHGDILYLGTPQSKDSIYKTLPTRGFSVRIWPGRYPTNEELSRYMPDTIAPAILEDIKNNPSLQHGGGITGEMGKPADTRRYTEMDLQEKELDYGAEGFALQFMLDTTLSDALRTRIKLSDIPVVGFGSENAPETLLYSLETRFEFKDRTPALLQDKMYWIASSSNNFLPYQHKVMQIDPAGSGGDEVAFCVGASINSYIHLFTVGGLKGGMTEDNIGKLLDVALEYNCNLIRVESNMGHGVVSSLIIAEIRNRGLSIGVEDFYAKGQKERRIIDTISPITRRHKLVVHKSAIEDDWAYCLQHSQDKRMQFSAFRQLADITYDRGSLAHDDRVDCIEAMCSYLVGTLALDDEALEKQREEEETREWLRNPMGYSSRVLGSNKRIKGRIRHYGRK